MREGRRQSVNDVCTFVLGYVKELVMLEKSYLETVHEALVQWCPPESQWVKVNFDGGFYSDLKASSAGTVIRNEAGLIMGTSCTWNRNIPSAEASEALAAI
ncbi:hypothetical protein V6Z11_D09G088800 [Gossypium hirsutum]